MGGTRAGGVRLTSGRLKGRRVATPAGEGTRPLLTRLRKSLADILRPRLQGARVLDLFGGSGAIAFELLSNGAARACVVERDPQAAELIRDNAAALGVAANTEVVAADALDAISDFGREGRVFDLIVIAPPYGTGLQQRALDALEAWPLLSADGVVVVQRDGREPAAVPPAKLSLRRTRRYGRTAFDFYQLDR